MTRAIRLGAAAILAAGTWAVGQERTGAVRVSVVPEHVDWTSAIGAPARFRVEITRDGHAPRRHDLAGLRPGVDAAGCREDGYPPRRRSRHRRRNDEGARLPAVRGDDHGGRPRVSVGGDGCLRAGEDRAGGENPPDFDAFWAPAKEDLAKLPIDARLTPKPDLSTAKADVYQVSLQIVGSDAKGASRFYGILAVPTAEESSRADEPAGAGARPYRGLVELAAKGFITLQVGSTASRWISPPRSTTACSPAPSTAAGATRHSTSTTPSATTTGASTSAACARTTSWSATRSGTGRT